MFTLEMFASTTQNVFSGMISEKGLVVFVNQLNVNFTRKECFIPVYLHRGHNLISYPI